MKQKEVTFLILVTLAFVLLTYQYVPYFVLFNPDTINDSDLSKSKLLADSTDKTSYYLKKNYWHASKVNIHLNPDKACELGAGYNLYVFAYVFTRVSNFEAREVIRRTWANRTLYPKLNIAFVLGLSSDPLENRRVRAENKLNGDILQGDFIDSYRNLSFKSLIAWKWIKQNCLNAKYFLKIDDDVLMNTGKLLDHVVATHQNPLNRIGAHSFSCIIWNESLAIRDRNDKMYVSVEDWLARTFPTYCRGVAYLMSNRLPAQLYTASLTTRDLWIDDAMTGLVASGIKNLVFNDWSRYFYLNGCEFNKEEGTLSSFFFFEPFNALNKTCTFLSTHLGVGF